MATRGPNVAGPTVGARDRFIQCQYRRHGDLVWHAQHPLHPSDQPASVTVLINDAEATAVYGWAKGKPMLWRSTGTEVVSGDRWAHLVAAEELPVIADLSKGPVALNGPKARWRWMVVS